MIDFTNLAVRNKTYAGANGSKISVIYNNELYMLKFPAIPAINKEMSYANGCISEYIGCHIFESIGIPVQKTLLGTYTKNGKQKIDLFKNPELIQKNLYQILIMKVYKIKRIV